MFIDSFNYDISRLLRKWSVKNGTMTINPTGGRLGLPALRCGAENGAYLKKYVPQSNCVTLGAAFKIPSDFTWNTTYVPLFAVYDAQGALQCFLTVTSNLAIAVYRNASGNYGVGSLPVLLGISNSGVVGIDTWFHLEWGVKVATSGTIEIRLNGTELISPTNANTQYSGLSGAAQVSLSTWNNGYGLGDKVWTTKCGVDISGIHFNWGNTVNFKGNCRVDSSLLTADASPQDWIPNTGEAWSLLNTGNSDYISSDVDEATSLFEKAELSFLTPQVHGIQINAYVVKSGAGTRECALVCKNGTTIAESANISLSETLAGTQAFFETNPDTETAWTLAAVNAATVGVRVKV